MSSSYKITVDKAIPFAESLFGQLGEVTLIAADDICSERLKKTDALIVRSITRVDEALLKNTSVSFVGSATIGTEHLDKDWLVSQSIHWCASPACNAVAVVQYVMSAIGYWLNIRQLTCDDICVGVVGYGAIGSRLTSLLSHLGIKCLVSDPPKQSSGELNNNCSLEELTKHCNIFSFHTPLTTAGPHATFQLISHDFFNQVDCQVPKLIINAARGDILDEAAAKQWCAKGGDLILDVWPNEPEIDATLLSEVLLGTSHIAGYSLEGKFNGSYQVYRQLAEFIGSTSTDKREKLEKELLPESSPITLKAGTSLASLFLSSYNIVNDYQLLKDGFQQQGASGFKCAREFYNFRREFKGQQWHGDKGLKPLKSFLNAL